MISTRISSPFRALSLSNDYSTHS